MREFGPAAPRETVGIAAASRWLPDGASQVREAVDSGRIRSRTARELGHESLPAAEDTAAPDMAVRAARAVLDATGTDPGRLDVLCHAWMYYQGHDLWSPSHYIAAELGAARAVPVGVQQVCNGGATALDMAASWLRDRRERAPDGTAWGLVTTGDRFAEPGFDRWAGDYGVAYGDGGTALLVRTPAGPGDALLLRALATVAAPELESMHRSGDPFGVAPRTHRDQVNMRATKRSYLRQHGNEGFTAANERSIRTVVAQALGDAGMSPRDPRLRCVVLPRFGLKTLREAWIPVLAECVAAPPVDYGRATGHLGAGDAAAGLADLIDGAVLAPGEVALVLSAGAGFTWSCLVVEAPPAVSRPARQNSTHNSEEPTKR
uniref:Ketoacyl-ACP synthase III family protein n=1 Tax=Streptomyces sp. NBC_00003 TaxID=2903608 RepID=A0AAU2V0U9_9ACTN